MLIEVDVEIHYCHSGNEMIVDDIAHFIEIMEYNKELFQAVVLYKEGSKAYITKRFNLIQNAMKWIQEIRDEYYSPLKRADYLGGISIKIDGFNFRLEVL